MLACLVLTFLYTKSNKKNSINHFIYPTPQGIHETQKKNIYAEEKQKVIPKNTHIHTQGKKTKENHSPHHRLDPILNNPSLQLDVYKICKRHKCCLSFLNTLSITYHWVGKGHYVKI